METLLFLKAWHVRKAMSFIFVLFLCLSCKAQDIPSVKEEKQILALVIQSKRELIKDSVIVNKAILPYDKSIFELKRSCVDASELTASEAEEIFGTDADFNGDTKSKFWSKSDFPVLNIVLCDGNNYSETVGSGDKKVQVNVTNLLSLSKPLFRKDSKYAVIKLENEQDGGVLQVLKKDHKTWKLHKTIQLYHI